jgi:hypothetical protein
MGRYDLSFTPETEPPPTPDCAKRRQQADTLAQLAGQGPAEDWRHSYARLAQFGLDRPGDWLLFREYWLMALLLEYPHLESKFPDRIRLSGVHWGMLLRQHPYLIRRLPPRCLNSRDWGFLLKAQPQLASYRGKRRTHAVTDVHSVPAGTPATMA